MKWPTWAPKDLIALHTAVLNCPPEDWIADPEVNCSYGAAGDGLSPLQHVVGVGDRVSVAALIVRLATDERMHEVWSACNELEMRRRGEFHSFHYPERDSYACRIVRICAISMSLVVTTAAVTRAAWRARHNKIANTARELAQLLNEDREVDGAFSYATILFSEKDLYNLASHVYHITRPLTSGDADTSDDLPEPLTDAEIAAEDKEHEPRIQSLKYWLTDALRREVRSPKELLKGFADLAALTGRTPPLFPLQDPNARCIAIITDGLHRYMQLAFRVQAHDKVATIASVATETEVTTESVKMRLRRQRLHYSKGIR